MDRDDNPSNNDIISENSEYKSSPVDDLFDFIIDTDASDMTESEETAPLGDRAALGDEENFVSDVNDKAADTGIVDTLDFVNGFKDLSDQEMKDNYPDLFDIKTENESRVDDAEDLVNVPDDNETYVPIDFEAGQNDIQGNSSGQDASSDVSVENAYEYGNLTEDPADASYDYGTASEDPGDASYDYGTASEDPGDASYDYGTASEDPADASYDYGTASEDPGDVSYDYGTASGEAGDMLYNYGNVSEGAGDVNFNNYAQEYPEEDEDISGVDDELDDLDDDLDDEDYEQSMIITEGTTITGSITTDCSLDVYGTIVGDIFCNGKLSISGKVTGNSHANEIMINAHRIEGNLESENVIKIGQGAVIIGNISAGAAAIAGAVKGDLDVKGTVILDSTAVIKGNIKAKSVQLINGAVLEGFCSLEYANSNVDDIFNKED